MENTMTLPEFTHSDGQSVMACVYCQSLFPCLFYAQKAKMQPYVAVKDTQCSCCRSAETFTVMGFSSFTFTSP